MVCLSGRDDKTFLLKPLYQKHNHQRQIIEANGEIVPFDQLSHGPDLHVKYRESKM